MTTPTNSVLIVGASARYAAQSALAAGVECWAVDLFGDWDLQRVANSFVIESLSGLKIDEILDWCNGIENWLMVGGIENRFDLIRQLGQRLRLLGPTLSSFENSKDIAKIQFVCAQDGISFPASHRVDERKMPPGSGDWLLKPIESAGGHQIKWACEFNDSDLRERFYLQRYIAGGSFSAVYCSSGKNSQLIGVTKQLCGCEPFINAQKQFAYCGSIGPIEIEKSLKFELEKIGRTIASELGMVGVFGIDFVVSDSQRIWLIEINPRIPASGEVFEKAGVIDSLVRLHLAGCDSHPLPDVSPKNNFVGKAIVFNRREGFVVEDAIFDDWMQILDRDNDALADVPMPGSLVSIDAPILTVFAKGESQCVVREKLELAARNTLERIKKLEV